MHSPNKYNQTPDNSSLEAIEHEESIRLTRLTENLPGSLYQYQINPDGSSFFPFATSGISQIYEYSAVEIQADAEKVFSRIHPDDVERITASIQQSALLMQDWHVEYRVNLPSKGLRWIRGQAKPQRLESGAILWHGYLNDITNEKIQANDLKRYQSQYRIAMEATQIGVWGWNVINNEVTWSDEAYTLLGYKPQQFIITFKSVQEQFIHPEDLEHFKHDVLTNLEENGRFHIHFRLKSASGEWLWIESRGRTTQFNEQGMPVYMMGTHTDITNIKHTEDALLDARKTAESATQAKSDLLSTVSHEIRTPLGGIIGLSELSLEENNPELLKETLRKIHRSSKQLLQILNDTLDYSKIEAGQLQRHNSSFNIEETIQDVICLFKPSATSKGLLLETHIDNLPQLVESDELRLRQILSNLISNAIKFTQQGKIIIQVSIQQSSDNTLQLEFSVTDTGIGIAPKIQKQLFAAYSQADTHTAHHYGGTGLGLVISERLVKLLGGEGIKLVSAPGQGACFSFVLPVKEAQACGEPTLTDNTKPECSKLMQGHLLVVDDVAINRELALHILESLGFTVATAENGQEAIDSALSEKFDLILMDLNMPIMDGFTATKYIKQHKPKLPVIALTASTIDSIQLKLNAAGFDGYITKPFIKQELCKTLKKWLPTSSLESPACKSTPVETVENFNFNHGLALFAGNEIAYIHLLSDFSTELNGRYFKLSEKIESLITQENLESDALLILHKETHALKGTSGNLGLNGLSLAATELDDLLRQGVKPDIKLLNNYQNQLNLAVEAIKTFIKEFKKPIIPATNHSNVSQIKSLSDNSISLDNLLSAVKTNEFIDEINLAQAANKIPSNLVNEWLVIADAIEGLDFAHAEQQLIELIAKIK